MLYDDVQDPRHCHPAEPRGTGCWISEPLAPSGPLYQAWCGADVGAHEVDVDVQGCLDNLSADEDDRLLSRWCVRAQPGHEVGLDCLPVGEREAGV